MSDDLSNVPSEVRAYVVTLMSPAGHFVQLPGLDKRSHHKVVYDLKLMQKEMVEKNATFCHKPILEGDRDNHGDGEVTVHNLSLVVAITSPFDVAGDEGDEDEDEIEETDEDDKPKKKFNL